MKKIICLVLSLILALSMVACSDVNSDVNPQTETSESAAVSENDGFTLNNSILGEEYTFTYTEVPKKVVSLASPATEMLLALGLEENIAGYAFQENVIPEKY